MASTLNGSGITFSSGGQLNDVPWYRSTTSTNTSFPIGSIVMVGAGGSYTNNNDITTSLNNSRTIYLSGNGSQGGVGMLYILGTLHAGVVTATALAGTWVRRGSGRGVYSCSVFSVSLPHLFQRIA